MAMMIASRAKYRVGSATMSYSFRLSAAEIPRALEIFGEE